MISCKHEEAEKEATQWMSTIKNVNYWTIQLFNYSTIECQLLRGSVLSDLFPEPRLSLKTFPLDDCIAYSVAMKDQIK